MAREEHSSRIGQMAKAAQAEGAETLDALKQGAAEVVGSARSAVAEAASARAEAGKDLVSDQGFALADKLRARAAETEGSLQSRVLGVLANGLEDASDDLRGQSLRDIVNGTERFARQNPGLFVMGATAAGFALARFLRAGADDAKESDKRDTADPGAPAERPVRPGPIATSPPTPPPPVSPRPEGFREGPS